MIKKTTQGVELFVGLHGFSVQGEADDLGGPRLFTAAHRIHRTDLKTKFEHYILDSGAFTDKPAKRLTPEKALDRQLAWEEKAEAQAFGFVSYDLLIDETWVENNKYKKRWDLKTSEWAITQTIEASKYLASQRARLQPRKLIFSAQGVDAIQYAECVSEVLKYCQPDDWFGLGGWCIIGRHQSYMPEYWKSLRVTLPLVQAAGIKHVHIFGVTFLPALGGLLWLADKHGLTVSTDSTKPVKDALWKNAEHRKKAGCRVASGYWRDNVQWWRNACNNLRNTKYYKEPPIALPGRQLSLFDLDLERIA